MPRVIPPRSEPLISMKEARLLLPTKCGYTKLYDWARTGVFGGEPRRRIRLESQLVGGRVWTTEGAVRRFLATLNGSLE